MVMVAISVVGLASALLLFYSSMVYSNPELAVEKVFLTNDQSIIVLRNTGNVRITRILTATLNCDSGEHQIDPSLFTPQPISGGGYSSAIVPLPLRPGEACRLHVQAVSETGQVLALSTGKVVVISQG